MARQESRSSGGSERVADGLNTSDLAPVARSLYHFSHRQHFSPRRGAYAAECNRQVITELQQRVLQQRETTAISHSKPNPARIARFFHIFHIQSARAAALPDLGILGRSHRFSSSGPCWPCRWSTRRPRGSGGGGFRRRRRCGLGPRHPHRLPPSWFQSRRVGRLCRACCGMAATAARPTSSGSDLLVRYSGSSGGVLASPLGALEGDGHRHVPRGPGRFVWGYWLYVRPRPLRFRTVGTMACRAATLAAVMRLSWCSAAWSEASRAPILPASSDDLRCTVSWCSLR